MGKFWPDAYDAEVRDGDEPTHSPTKNQNSLLAAQRGTDSTRRIETDASGNVLVNVAANSSEVPNLFATGTQTSLADNVTVTIATYTAGANDTAVTRVTCSGTDYAKFELFKNLSLIETKRSGPDRNVEFGAVGLVENDIIEIKVTHYDTTITANFEASIFGV